MVDGGGYREPMPDEEVTVPVRPARRLRPVALVVAVLILLVAWGGWRLGAPDLVQNGAAGDGYGWDPVRVSFSVTNDGLTNVTLVGVGRSGPGFELQRADGIPVLLPPGESGRITLVYRVTDCGRVPTGAWPVPVVAVTWRGESTVYLDQPRQQRRDDLPEPQGPDVEWQEGLAAKNCALTGRS
ncbi:hypothetical protein GCM10009661_82190 [Catellatospora chokoriensis]|uniref:Uncharacterized protein n=2 Tax=Catellatospora chokoriensis TaxID=310353 RepID=A0A8J3KAZ1_9ACTN|nr:hypothetical protein Cch02nite_67920 [Catellatospora chokoriensis]